MCNAIKNIRAIFENDFENLKIKTNFKIKINHYKTL